MSSSSSGSSSGTSSSSSGSSGNSKDCGGITSRPNREGRYYYDERLCKFIPISDKPRPRSSSNSQSQARKIIIIRCPPPPPPPPPQTYYQVPYPLPYHHNPCCPPPFSPFSPFCNPLFPPGCSPFPPMNLTGLNNAGVSGVSPAAPPVAIPTNTPGPGNVVSQAQNLPK